MYKFVLTIAFSLFAILSSAQDQWLVTTKLDTIRGKIFIENGGQYKADVARAKEGKNKTSYKCYQVRSVTLGKNETYEVLKIDERYQFVLVDLKGKYFSQYLYIDPSSGANANYALKILVNWKGEQFKIGNLTSKKKLAEYFEDCESVSAKIESGEYKRKHIEKIISAYDRCIENSKNTKTVPIAKVVVPDSKMASFISDLKSNNLYVGDLSMMIDDINQKLSNQQPIPAYLQQAVLEQLEDNEDLKEAFTDLMKKDTD